MMRSDNACAKISLEQPGSKTFSLFHFSEHVVYFLLNNISRNGLTIIDHNTNTRFFGKKDVGHQVTLRVRDPHFFSRVRAGGPLSLGEMYMEGGWDVEGGELSTFFQLLLSEHLGEHIPGNFLQQIVSSLAAARSSPSTVSVAKKDIEKHYDLGNEFYRYMLDHSMTYSCGYQQSDDDSLAKMQENKYHRVAEKLQLQRGGNLVDIGCGWGGMLLYSAQHFPNIRCHGITLSEQQFEHVQTRIRDEGFGERVSVELRDYRELNGRYDFVVSIGMFEHVGLSQYPIFFQKLRELLTDGGIGLLHTIAQEEDPSLPQDHWIQKYIFPGSRLPRLEEIASNMRKAELVVGHVENLRPHYAITLRKWYENFMLHWSTIQRLSPQFDERFYRMWRYYLQLCEACFINSSTELYQVGFCGRAQWSFPQHFQFRHCQS